jgi:hypothetical protein
LFWDSDFARVNVRRERAGWIASQNWDAGTGWPVASLVNVASP